MEKIREGKGLSSPGERAENNCCTRA